MTAARIACVSRCLFFQYSSHGSFRCRESLARVVSIVHCEGSSVGRSSSQRTGIETGAPGQARVEYAAMDVLVRLFLR